LYSNISLIISNLRIVNNQVANLINKQLKGETFSHHLKYGIIALEDYLGISIQRE